MGSGTPRVCLSMEAIGTNDNTGTPAALLGTGAALQGFVMDCVQAAAVKEDGLLLVMLTHTAAAPAAGHQHVLHQLGVEAAAAGAAALAGLRSPRIQLNSVKAESAAVAVAAEAEVAAEEHPKGAARDSKLVYSCHPALTQRAYGQQ